MRKQKQETLKLIDYIGELVGEPFQTKTGSDNDLLANPQPSIPAPVSTNNRSVDRHLDDIPSDSVHTIRRAVENPDVVDEPVLRKLGQYQESRRRAARAQERCFVP